MSSESSASSASSAPSADPVAVVGCYLWGLHHEAVRRGYRLERSHLEAKLARRAPDLLPLPERLEPHPLFHVVPGDVESWEHAVI